jgi:hypothetical protein
MTIRKVCLYVNNKKNSIDEVLYKTYAYLQSQCKINSEHACTLYTLYTISYGREKYQDFANCKRTSLLTRVWSYTLRVRTYVIQLYKNDPDIGIHSKSFWFGEQECDGYLCDVSHLNFWEMVAFEPRELKKVLSSGQPQKRGTSR